MLMCAYFFTGTAVWGAAAFCGAGAPFEAGVFDVAGTALPFAETSFFSACGQVVLLLTAELTGRHCAALLALSLPRIYQTPPQRPATRRRIRTKSSLLFQTPSTRLDTKFERTFLPGGRAGVKVKIFPSFQLIRILRLTAQPVASRNRERSRR